MAVPGQQGLRRAPNSGRRRHRLAGTGATESRRSVRGADLARLRHYRRPPSEGRCLPWAGIRIATETGPWRCRPYSVQLRPTAFPCPSSWFETQPPACSFLPPPPQFCGQRRSVARAQMNPLLPFADPAYPPIPSTFREGRLRPKALIRTCFPPKYFVQRTTEPARLQSRTVWGASVLGISRRLYSKRDAARCHRPRPFTERSQSKVFKAICEGRGP